MELDPLYIDTALLRWEAYAGEAAVPADTGQTFAEVSASRLGGREPSIIEHNPIEPEEQSADVE